ncbi:MAG TPA: DUF5615 family PIN-like protein [Chthonomonadaceae bacterium]|nr:DUF5615 family PIN-like protein [Chthonomonadaceae bacterium]
MIPFYADENIDGKILRGLRSRKIDVVTASEDRRNAIDDALVFQRASELGRVLLSQDEDMLRIAERCLRTGTDFAGLIYAHKLRATVRQCIDDLELISECQSPEEYLNCIVRLPL